MIKGFVISPVVVGRISIGALVDNNKTGKKMPVKQDHFTITTTTQTGGKWETHPMMESLGQEPREIPVRIMFNSPENNFRAQYTAFTGAGRVLCTGDGDTARRLDPKAEKGVSEHACPGPDRCQFGQTARCKSYGRLLVGVEGVWQKDPLSGFAFRTTSWNSIRALTARLQYLHAISGGVMAGMPCTLVLRAKSTAASMRQPVYYVDLVPRGSLEEAVEEARTWAQNWAKAGLDWPRLEEAVANGYAASAFEDEDEDVVSEFYPDSDSTAPAAAPAATAEASPDAVVDARTEALISSLQSRLENIKDEEGIAQARAWARNRFVENPEALRRVEDLLGERLAEITASASGQTAEAA